MKNRIDIRLIHGGIHQSGQGIDALLQSVLQGSADQIKCEPEHHAHDQNEDGDGGPFSCEDPVDPFAAQAFPALCRLMNIGLAHLVDEGETHVRNGGASVQSPFLFHLENDMLQSLRLIFVQTQLFQDALIPLDHLACSKAKGQICSLRMILDQVHGGVKSPVHRTLMVVLVTEILPERLFLKMCHVERMLDQLADTAPFGSGNGDDRNTELGLQSIDVDGPAVCGHLIHHVQCNDHGDVHFQKLHGKIQVPFDIGGIHDVDDGLRLFPKDKITGYQFFRTIGRHGVDAGQVRDQGLRISFDHAVLSIHCYAGKVPDSLIGTGELVEERGLATVLIAHQCKGQCGSLRQRITAPLGVKLSTLPQTGMDGLIGKLFIGGGLFCCFCSICSVFSIFSRFLLYGQDLDLGSVRQPKGQLIAVDGEFHGIPHGSVLHHSHFLAGDHTHVKKMLAQSSVSANRSDHGTFSDFQLP